MTLMEWDLLLHCLDDECLVLKIKVKSANSFQTEIAMNSLTTDAV